MSMFGGLKFFPTPDIEEKVEKAPEVAPALNEAARNVKNAAVSGAPKRRARGYASKFRVVEAADVEGVQTAYVVNDDVAAHLVEFGSVNNPPYRPLTRAAQSVGEFTDAHDE